MRTLLVDDDPNICTIYGDVLKDEGHEVTIIHRAEDARKALLTNAFDSVVLDLCLGEESGLSVAALASYANPNCRLIVITGSTLFARGELFGMAPNIAAVMRKPVAIGDLVAVLEYDTAYAERIPA